MQTAPRFIALDVALQAIDRLRPLVKTIATHDRDLAQQIRRAASSIALNLAEASGSTAGTRRARLLSARGSLEETRAALRVALAWRYVTASALGCVELDLDRLGALSWRLLHPR